MADFEFVDPSTGAVLGTHAYGTVAAGTASAAWAARLRYKYGLSGSGLYQTALILEVSEDGGATYRTDITDFTIAVTATVNTPADPLFLGTVLSASRTNRLELAPLRAGCAYDLAIVFSPTLKTGTATSAYTWRLGVIYNESVQAISLNPDAPTGILSGLGDLSVSEWEIAPTLALGTDEVTLGASAGVVTGVAVSNAGGAAALNQTSSTGALASGQEYIALLSMDTFGDVITTKGAKASAGAAVQPAFPAGNLPIAVVRVPYGGVIATGTLVAVTGYCWVAAGTGLTVTVQPGRAVMPGLYLTPGVVQTLTVPNNTTTRVYLSGQAVANTVSGVALADVTTSGGAVTGVSDARTMLYQGLQPKLFATVDAMGNTVTQLGHPTDVSDPTDAATWGSVMARTAKTSVSVVVDANVTLSGEQTLDSIAHYDGDVVLASNQTDPLEIGKWIVRSGAWERHPDCATAERCVAGAQVYVRLGTYGRQVWIQTADIVDYNADAQVWEPMVVLA